MKVAFASADGVVIDQHFGMAPSYFIWDVGPRTAEFLSAVSPIGTGDEEDKTTARANAIDGCTIVYTVQIGGPAAAKLIARRIHPLKTQAAVPISEAIDKLQEVLRGTPPPWLRRALKEKEASTDPK